MIGAHLRRVRQARGFSLQTLANQLARPVTRAALSKYEHGKTVPRADMLLDLARVLGVPSSYFLDSNGDTEVGIDWLAYRKHSSLGKREQARLQAHAEMSAGAFRRLLGLLHPGEESRFPTRTTATTEEEAEDAADSLRSHWGLGVSPIDSVVSCVEDAGALVLGWKDHAHFDALSGRTRSNRPVIVMNLDRPDDRRRFNLAHELGHLVLATSSLKPKDEETLAHRFAAAFLVPRAAAYHELGKRRVRITFAELEYLKTKYGFSMQAWTRRARDLGILSDQSYRGWQIWFRSKGLHKREPIAYRGHETPSRLRILAVQALAEGLVDSSWVGSFCPDAVADREQESPIRELVRQHVGDRRRTIEEAAAAAADDYRDDPDVASFLDFGDREEAD